MYAALSCLCRMPYTSSVSFQASSRATCSALLCAIFQNYRQRRDWQEGGRGVGSRSAGGGGAGIEEAVEALRKSGFVNYFGLPVLVYEAFHC